MFQILSKQKVIRGHQNKDSFHPANRPSVMKRVLSASWITSLYQCCCLSDLPLMYLERETYFAPHAVTASALYFTPHAPCVYLLDCVLIILTSRQENVEWGEKQSEQACLGWRRTVALMLSGTHFPRSYIGLLRASTVKTLLTLITSMWEFFTNSFTVSGLFENHNLFN